MWALRPLLSLLQEAMQPNRVVGVCIDSERQGLELLVLGTAGAASAGIILNGID
jgi:hypothetical protein